MSAPAQVAAQTTLVAIGADALMRLRAGDQDFDGLTDDEQRAVVAQMQARGHSPISVAQALGVSPPRVARIATELLHERGRITVTVSRDAIIGQLALAAQVAADGLHANGRWMEYWRVHREYAQDLARLGVLQESARRVDVHHTHELSAAQQEDLQRLRELDQKREARKIEIVRSREDAEDPLPLLGTVDADTLPRHLSAEDQNQ